ncbi:hypothetical protein JCM10207_008033 [Rhodosporidiobolus poonsookiae]
MEDLTPELVSLITALHLSNLAELNQACKGKGKEGTISDEEAAFNLYRDELEETEQVLGDMRMALSLERAGGQDREALDSLAEEEEAARRDRQLALAVSQGRPFPRTVVVTALTTSSSTSAGTPASTRATTPASTITRPTTASSASSPAPVASSSTLKVECVICGDASTSKTADESLFSPRCDGTPIPLTLAEPHLSAAEFTTYRAAASEFSTPHRLYCATPTCSAFLGAASSSKDKAAVQCDACGGKTCSACKAPWHGLFGLCGAGSDDEAAGVLARERGYQRCPGCRRMVELDHGCFHMTCMCHREFCYLCAAEWKNCECPQWDEARLLRAAEDRVRVAEQARPRNDFQPLAPRVNRIAEAVEQLRVNHECTHTRWRHRTGPGRCQSCFHYLDRFLKRCVDCQMLACVRCTRNRL